MRPQDDYRNGDGGSDEHEDDSEGSEGAPEDDLSVYDSGAPARALAALNALRKSRQHYDVLLVAEGAEVAAHRAVLAAASPYLLEALTAAPAQPPAPPASPQPAPAYRVEGVEAEPLRALVEYAYTGRLRVREVSAARQLYRAAWRLRVDAVRAHLADRLLRRLTPADCLDVRALPDLEPHHLATVDAYIAQHFEEVCSAGALTALPMIRIEMLRESSADDGEEAPRAVAEAALAWLRDQQVGDVNLEELCSRTHLLFVDAGGSLRDCGELPAARGDAPELQEYQREAAERGQRRRDNKQPHGAAPAPLAGLELGARAERGDYAVLAVRGLGERATRALISLRGRLTAARIAWRAGGSVARGAPLGGARDRDGDESRALLATPRCAHGIAELTGRLLVCGGYDRARVLRAAAAYDPISNTWSSLPDMRSARARFPAVRLGRRVYTLGGSDGHAELDSVDVYEEEVDGRGAWKARAKLPLALSHAAAAADEERGELYVIGGWAGGLSLKRVHKYSPEEDKWTEAPPLNTGRSQCAGVQWNGALWVLGGCDAWHCLASTETLPLRAGGAAWAAGPALPTARRSVGGAVWRGRLVSVGGSEGAASLRRTDWLAVGGEWRAGPPLRRARAALGLAVLADALYAVGGFSGKEFLSCVECLYSPDGEWTALCAPPPPRPALTPNSVDDTYTQENGDIVDNGQ